MAAYIFAILRHAANHLQERFHRRTTLLHVRLDAGVDRPGQLGVDLRAKAVNVDRGLVVAHGRHARGAPQPRQLERANLIGRHAEGEHVEPLVRRPAVDQLRGHVVGRARAVARLHEPPRGRHGQTEVDQLQVFELLVSNKFRGQMSRWMNPAA